MQVCVNMYYFAHLKHYVSGMPLYATCYFFVNVFEINLCGRMCLIYLLPCKI